MILDEKIREIIKKYLGYGIVFMICVVYTATAFIIIDTTGKTITQIIADGFVAFFIGLFIKQILELQGMNQAMSDSKVIEALNRHEQTVDKLTPYIGQLDKWCDSENDKNVLIQRSKLLAQAGLRYEEYFSPEGVAKNYTPDAKRMKNKVLKKDEKRRVALFKKAVMISDKLTPLSVNDLTSEGAHPDDPFYLGKTKTEYEKSQNIKSIFSRIGTSVLFGYFGVKLVQDFNVASLVWTLLQISTFLLMGMINQNKAYQFVIDEYRGRIMNKVHYLDKFLNQVTKTDADLLIERRAEELRRIEEEKNKESEDITNGN